MRDLAGVAYAGGAFPDPPYPLGGGAGPGATSDSDGDGRAPIGQVVPADLDGDGRPDVIVLNQQTSAVSVYLTEAGGRLASPQVCSVLHGPPRLVVGDLNGDGRPDLAVASQDTDSVGVLLSQGGGRSRPRRPTRRLLPARSSPPI